MSATYYNRWTRTTAATLGIVLGLAGAINHGIFEILQGNTPTGGLFIEAIGPAHRFWLHGTEGAISLLPTFLLSGIAAVFFSLAVITWSVKYIDTAHGVTVFLLLMVGLTLVGGGLGHIVLFLPTWAWATRINARLTWWRKMLVGTVRRMLIRLWGPTFVVTIISWIVVMELGIFGYFPGQQDPDVVLNITFGFVLLTVAFANATFICALARDIESESIDPIGVLGATTR